MSIDTKAAKQAFQRLRAIADAFEGGEGLIDIAARYRIPVTALHRVVTPKTRYYRPETAVNAEMVTRAVKLVRGGKTVKEAAAILEVRYPTLKSSLTKRGFTVDSLRARLRGQPDYVRLAILDYQRGISVAKICRDREIAPHTLYMHLRKRGISLRGRRTKLPSSTDSSV